MKRVAIVGNVASMMISFRGDLIRRISGDGNTVFCFCVDFNDVSREHVTRLGGIPIDYRLNSKGMNPFVDLHDIFSLRKMLVELQVDVVLAYFVKPALFGGLAARMAGVARIVGMIEGLGNAFVEYEEFSLKRFTVKYSQIALYKLLSRNLDVLIFLNVDDKNDVVDKYHVATRRVEVLGGIGVDLEEFSPRIREPSKLALTFVFVARLLREKGIFEFLRAAELIKSSYPDIRFLVLGGIDEGNPFALKGSELRDYIDRGVIEYPGFVSNVGEWVGDADVFVLPSFYREGVPRSTQEAMALGKPIITTDVPGCRDTVVHGMNGLLIEPRSVDSLVEAMNFFISQPGFIAEMGVQSRILAEKKFDVHKVNSRLVEILDL